MDYLSNRLKCCSCGDSNRYTKNLQIFRFIKPTVANYDRAKIWAEFAFPGQVWDHRKLLRLHSINRVICEKHFIDSDFVNYLKKRLNRNAIPRIHTEQVSTKTYVNNFHNDEVKSSLNNEHTVSPDEPLTKLPFNEVVVSTSVDICNEPLPELPVIEKFNLNNELSDDFQEPLPDFEHNDTLITPNFDYVADVPFSILTNDCTPISKHELDDVSRCDVEPVNVSKPVSRPEPIKKKIVKKVPCANKTIKAVGQLNTNKMSSLKENVAKDTVKPASSSIDKTTAEKVPFANITVKAVRPLNRNEMNSLKENVAKDTITLASSSINKKIFVKKFTISPCAIAQTQKMKERVVYKKNPSTPYYNDYVVQLRKEIKCLKQKVNRQKVTIQKLSESSKLSVNRKLPTLPEIDRGTAITKNLAILTKEQSKFCFACLGTDDLSPMSTKKNDCQPQFSFVTSVQIPRGDQSYLCLPCLTITEYMYKFKKQCLEVDEKLKEIEGCFTQQPDPYNNQIMIEIQDLLKFNVRNEQPLQTAQTDEENASNDTAETKTLLNGVVNKWKHSRKANKLTVMKKYEILQEIDKMKIKPKALARMYGISIKTVYAILRNRNKIEHAVKNHIDGIIKIRPKKILRTPKAECRLLDSVVYNCFSTDIENTTDAMWIQKATSVAEEMNLKYFTANKGWLSRFKKRFKIVELQNTTSDVFNLGAL